MPWETTKRLCHESFGLSIHYRKSISQANASWDTKIPIILSKRKTNAKRKGNKGRRMWGMTGSHLFWHVRTDKSADKLPITLDAFNLLSTRSTHSNKHSILTGIYSVLLWVLSLSLCTHFNWNWKCVTIPWACRAPESDSDDNGALGRKNACINM